MSAPDLDELAAATDGVTASFLKELLRRAVLEALREQGTLTEVTGEHLSRALDDLLDTTQRVTRTLLGVGGDPDALATGPAVPPLHTAGWLPHPGRVRHHLP